MRQFRAIMCALLVVLMLSSFAVSAEVVVDQTGFTQGIGFAPVNNGTPVIDGSVSASEGWGNSVTFNASNMGLFWDAHSRCIISGTMSFAWDNTNLYVAAQIKDPGFIASTDVDTIDNSYAYNGDVCAFAIDPAKQCQEAGYLTGEFTPWYCVTYFQGAGFKCSKLDASSGTSEELADVKGSAVTTSDGWTFECSIPWTVIFEDIEAVTYKDVQPVLSAITANGTVSNSAMIYIDRAAYGGDFTQFAPSSLTLAEGQIFTVSKEATIPTLMLDGMSATTQGDIFINAYGMYLVMADASGTFPAEATATAENGTTAPEDTDGSNDTKKVTETTKAAETTKKSDETTKKSAADIGSNKKKSDDSEFPVVLVVVIVVAVLAIAGVVVFFLLKKKKAADATKKTTDADKNSDNK